MGSTTTNKNCAVAYTYIWYRLCSVGSIVTFSPLLTLVQSLQTFQHQVTNPKPVVLFTKSEIMNILRFESFTGIISIILNTQCQLPGFCTDIIAVE